MTETPPVVVTSSNGVIQLELNREAKYNAINTEVIGAMRSTIADARRDPTVGAILITARGRAFCAGADISEYADTAPEDLQLFTARANALCREIERVPQPVVAAVNGVALGGGFELALSCDILIASTAASFGLPEINLGLIPGWGGTQRVSRLLGRHRATAMITLGERIPPQQAQALGIVYDVCDPSELENTARNLAERLASGPRAATQAAKRSIAAEASIPERGFETEQQLLDSLFRTADGIEGVRAFTEKRRPQFRDRPEIAPHPKPS